MTTVQLLVCTDQVLLRSLVDRTPEFDAIGAAEIADRLAQPNSLALVAMEDGQPLGYKIGYQRWSDGSWYSWLGAIFPEHRGRGVAQQLLAEQQRWVTAQGYTSIRVKTRNRFVGMRILLARNGYELIEMTRDGLARPDYRLLFEKSLTGSKAPKG